MRISYDGFIQGTPATEEIDEDMNTSIEDLNAALDAYRRDEIDYEAQCFAASCVYDASAELPF